MRKMFFAMTVMVVAGSFVVADEFMGRITAVSEDGKEITVIKGFGFPKKGEDQPEPIKLKVADNVKVMKGKFDPETKGIVATDEAVEGGLKSEMFQNLGKKKGDEGEKKGGRRGGRGRGGVFAQITTNDDNQVTNITVMQFGGRGGRGKGKGGGGGGQ